MTVTSTVTPYHNAAKEMDTVRIAFIKAMGIKSKYRNPDPNGGYKVEFNYAKRQENLAEAQKLRDTYAELVKTYKVNQYILDKMNSNLKNRDLRVSWSD
jgi:hypothetical protein